MCSRAVVSSKATCPLSTCDDYQWRLILIVEPSLTRRHESESRFKSSSRRLNKLLIVIEFNNDFCSCASALVDIIALVARFAHFVCNSVAARDKNSATIRNLLKITDYQPAREQHVGLRPPRMSADGNEGRSVSSSGTITTITTTTATTTTTTIPVSHTVAQGSPIEQQHTAPPLWSHQQQQQQPQQQQLQPTCLSIARPTPTRQSPPRQTFFRPPLTPPEHQYLPYDAYFESARSFRPYGGIVPTFHEPTAFPPSFFARQHPSSVMRRPYLTRASDALIQINLQRRSSYPSFPSYLTGAMPGMGSSGGGGGGLEPVSPPSATTVSQTAQGCSTPQHPVSSIYPSTTTERKVKIESPQQDLAGHIPQRVVTLPPPPPPSRHLMPPSHQHHSLPSILSSIRHMTVSAAASSPSNDPVSPPSRGSRGGGGATELLPPQSSWSIDDQSSWLPPHHSRRTPPPSLPFGSSTVAQSSDAHSSSRQQQQPHYPPHFMRGSVIQLASGALKRVEDLRTQDFVQSANVSDNLRLDSSTVVHMRQNHERDTVVLGFSVGDKNIQVTVEATLEHPFYVFNQGWSSYSPHLTLRRYGLQCHPLSVGDRCISITQKDVPVVTPHQQPLPSTTQQDSHPAASASSPVTSRSPTRFVHHHRIDTTISHSLGAAPLQDEASGHTTVHEPSVIPPSRGGGRLSLSETVGATPMMTTAAHLHYPRHHLTTTLSTSEDNPLSSAPSRCSAATTAVIQAPPIGSGVTIPTAPSLLRSRKRRSSAPPVISADVGYNIVGDAPPLHAAQGSVEPSTSLRTLTQVTDPPQQGGLVSASGTSSSQYGSHRIVDVSESEWGGPTPPKTSRKGDAE